MVSGRKKLQILIQLLRHASTMIMVLWLFFSHGISWLHGCYIGIWKFFCLDFGLVSNCDTWSACSFSWLQGIWTKTNSLLWCLYVLQISDNFVDKEFGKFILKKENYKLILQIQYLWYMNCDNCATPTNSKMVKLDHCSEFFFWLICVFVCFFFFY